MRPRFLTDGSLAAAGFKLKFDELVQPQWSGIRALVEADRDLRIVLRRRDPAAPYLCTGWCCSRPGSPTSRRAGSARSRAVRIDIDDCLRDIAETRRREREFEAAFAGHPSLRVVHEPAGRRSAGAVRPRIRTSAGAGAGAGGDQKGSCAPPDALVLNYPELQAALRASSKPPPESRAASGGRCGRRQRQPFGL